MYEPPASNPSEMGYYDAPTTEGGEMLKADDPSNPFRCPFCDSRKDEMAATCADESCIEYLDKASRFDPSEAVLRARGEL